MDLIVIILVGVVIYAMIAVPIKRSKHTSNCPRCGTKCNASPWGTGMYYEVKYKCPKCGEVFYRSYSKL